MIGVSLQEVAKYTPWIAERLRRRKLRASHYGMGVSLSIDVFDQSSSTGGFNGNFSTIFTGALQIVQSDLGLTYGGIPVATAGNTSTTVLTQTGTIAGVYVPILVKATNTLAIGSGAQFSISYDGGSTFAMTGVTPTAGLPVALTGAGAGLSISWTAGTSVINDAWRATCAGLADQSGNVKDYSQALAAKQPVLGVGINGRCSVDWDGVDDVLASTLATPVPGVTPYFFYGVWRAAAKGSAMQMLGDTGGISHVIDSNLGTLADVRQFNGGSANSQAMAANTWLRVHARFGNSIADFLKIGSAVAITGQNAGNNAGSGALLGAATAAGAQSSPLKLVLAVFTPVATQFAAADAAVTQYYNGLVTV